MNNRSIATELLRIAATLVGSPFSPKSGPSGFFTKQGERAKILHVLAGLVLNSNKLVSKVANEANVDTAKVEQVLQAFRQKASAKPSSRNKGHQRPVSPQELGEQPTQPAVTLPSA